MTVREYRVQNIGGKDKAQVLQFNKKNTNIHQNGGSQNVRYSENTPILITTNSNPSSPEQSNTS